MTSTPQKQCLSSDISAQIATIICAEKEPGPPQEATPQWMMDLVSLVHSVIKKIFLKFKLFLMSFILI